AMASLERRSGSLLTTAFYVNQMQGLDIAVAEVGSDRAEGLYELGRAFTMEEAIQFAVEDEEISGRPLVAEGI
ncbi:MAG: hypothetical protein ACRD1T_09240, partial [Acidimicrobiia bacterium]